MEYEYYSKSFELFDKIRNDANKYDMIVLLREYSNNYDIELLEILLKDIEFYLFVEIDEKKSEFTSEDISNAINDRQKNDLEIPYIKTKIVSDLTDRQKENRKKHKNLLFQHSNIIDLESLMFPYEFFNVRTFKNLIVKKINELKQNNIVKNFKSNITQTELIELIKALIENETIIGKQKDIIKDFSTFFNIEVNNPDKIITDIKKRNNGSETLFLDKLKTSLFNYIKK